MGAVKLSSAPDYFTIQFEDERTAISFQALCAIYPGSLSAKQLMNKAGLRWQTNQLGSFVSLCNQFIKINQVLKGHGWQALRSDGTPSGKYWLSPIGG